MTSTLRIILLALLVDIGLVVSLLVWGNALITPLVIWQVVKLAYVATGLVGLWSIKQRSKKWPH